MSAKAPIGKRNERAAHLRWVPLGKMRVNPVAQRELRSYWVADILARFDPERYTPPTVNEREDGWFNIINGQHSTEAYKQWLGEGHWEDQFVQCWAYVGMTDEEEADMFLDLNKMLGIAALPKFRAAVKAGRPIECDVDRIVRAQGLRVSADKSDGAIGAVGTLVRVYNRAGGPTLGKALRIIRDSYGDPGLEALVIDGVGLLCQRYNGDIDDVRVIARFRAVSGGVHGLLNRAETLRKQTGNPKPHCVAAAAVDIINAGKGGKKLPSWWKPSE